MKYSRNDSENAQITRLLESAKEMINVMINDYD